MQDKAEGDLQVAKGLGGLQSELLNILFLRPSVVANRVAIGT